MRGFMDLGLKKAPFSAEKDLGVSPPSDFGVLRLGAADAHDEAVMCAVRVARFNTKMPGGTTRCDWKGFFL